MSETLNGLLRWAGLAEAPPAITPNALNQPPPPVNLSDPSYWDATTGLPTLAGIPLLTPRTEDQQ